MLLRKSPYIPALEPELSGQAMIKLAPILQRDTSPTIEQMLSSIILVIVPPSSSSLPTPTSTDALVPTTTKEKLLNYYLQPYLDSPVISSTSEGASGVSPTSKGVQKRKHNYEGVQKKKNIQYKHNQLVRHTHHSI